MSYTARELINRAFYLSGIVSRKFQEVSGDQVTDGLNLLNEALAEVGIKGTLIPYYKEYEFPAVAGQEKYFIPGLISAECLTFNIGTIRYEMAPTLRKKYFGTGRADNIQTLPSSWHYERTLNGADIYLYFLPDTNYPMKLWGKFKLDEITDLCADLSLVYDSYYIKYLTYALASDICEEYGVVLPPKTEYKLQSLEAKLTYVSPMDLTQIKRTPHSGRTAPNYGMANLGTGWTV